MLRTRLGALVDGWDGALVAGRDGAPVVVTDGSTAGELPVGPVPTVVDPED